MRALILSAGFGTRLGAPGLERPKGLLPVGHRTAADLLADHVDAVPGITSLDCWTHERGRAAFEEWAERRVGRLPIRVASNGVRHAEDRLGAVLDLSRSLERFGMDEPLLVLAGDNVFDFSLGPLAAASEQTPAVVCRDVGTKDRVSRLASVALDATNRITALVEKDPDPPSTLAATALLGISRDALPDVERYLATDGNRDNLGFLLAWWIHERFIRGVCPPSTSRWLDIGHPEDLERAARWESALPRSAQVRTPNWTR